MRNSFFTQGLGLTFRRKMNDFAMIFPFETPRRIGITMFFVFFPIDLLLLDSKNKVVDLKENLKPFQNYWPKTNKSTTLIEFPKGYISKYNIKLNDEFTWNDGVLKQLKA